MATIATITAMAPIPRAVADVLAGVLNPPARGRAGGWFRVRVSVRRRKRTAAARSANPTTSNAEGTAIEGMSDTATSPTAATSGIRAVMTTWSMTIARS
ncbi:MAG: hypothetical protein J0I66_02555, partial [Microbacterium sp.]|nr:hypothetical protein [Microbacterium sp.]